MGNIDKYRGCLVDGAAGDALGDTVSNNIIMFPDYKKIKIEVEKLRTELSMLVLERDELQYVECKNIEMLYMLALGSLEYKVYEAQCAVLRLKRKLELIQSKRNRQEKVVLSQIEDTLDTEFTEYQEKLNAQINKMNDAIKRSQAEFLTVEESKELKKLYRNIVKSLHPDLHPELSDAQRTMFENAVTAYKNCDLETLRIISEMVCEPILAEDGKDAMTQLVHEKDRLVAMLQDVKDSIARIKSEYPYTVKEIVRDKEEIATRKAELERILRQYNEVMIAYSTKIREMLR